jgi:preprotein translocase SecE subunit
MAHERKRGKRRREGRGKPADRDERNLGPADDQSDESSEPDQESNAQEEEFEPEEQEISAAATLEGERHEGGGSRLLGFLAASWHELQRVQWPDRQQVIQATAVVLAFVVIMGLYLGLSDFVFQRIVQAII